MKCLREPLLHFVLLGAVMFVIYGRVAEERGGKPGHIVVTQGTAGRIPELADAREAVRRAWANARRLETNETFYRTLLRRYTVTIERPPPGGEDKSLGEVRR